MAYQISSFLAFPVDVLHCVADCLSEGDIVFLAMTCKALYPIMRGRIQQLAHMKPKSRALILSWLQRHNPDRYACFCSGRLRRYRILRGKIIDDEENHRLCSYWAGLFVNNGRGFPWDSLMGYKLQFYKARLVMNQCFNGCGAPLNTISYIRNMVVRHHYTLPFRYGIKMHAIWTPRIINDRLYFYRRLAFNMAADHHKTSTFLHRGRHLQYVATYIRQHSVLGTKGRRVRTSLAKAPAN
jgi:hypothetical protein